MMAQYKAEHIVGSWQYLPRRMQVFNVIRVSLGVQPSIVIWPARERNRLLCRLFSGEVNIGYFEQDRSDAAPCAGVNSMVKLLRPHGGCLGRDRR